jgi:hypothetical protein
LTYFAIFSWSEKKYQYFCPPPVPKTKKRSGVEAHDDSSPGAMTGNDYSLILHCTVGHLRRVDGALPDFADGEKAVNFFAPTPTPMYIFCIFYVLYIFDIFDILIFFKAYYSCVTTSLWILVLFHDSSCDRSFTSANPPQISSENRC